eukprot:3260453-Rhodomonas_salina.3
MVLQRRHGLLYMPRYRRSRCALLSANETAPGCQVLTQAKTPLPEWFEKVGRPTEEEEVHAPSDTPSFPYLVPSLLLAFSFRLINKGCDLLCSCL